MTPFVGAGSDHASFLFYAGVPVMDITFVEDEKVHPGMSGYPAYHTGFETFDLVDRIYDPDYKVFRACAQLNLRLSLQLAESPVLPLRMTPYAQVSFHLYKNVKCLNRKSYREGSFFPVEIWQKSGTTANYMGRVLATAVM